MYDDYFFDEEDEDLNWSEDETKELDMENYEIYFEQHITRQIRAVVECEDETTLLSEIRRIENIMYENPEYDEECLMALLSDSPYIEMLDTEEDFKIEKEQPMYLEHFEL